MDKQDLIDAGLTSPTPSPLPPNSTPVLRPPTLESPQLASTPAPAPAPAPGTSGKKRQAKAPPASKKSGQKRKTTVYQTPRNLRLRPRSNSTPKTVNEDLVNVLQEIAGESTMSQDSAMTHVSQKTPAAPAAATAPDPFTLFQAYMDKQFSSLKNELSVFKQEVSDSVKDVSAQVSANTNNIKSLQDGLGEKIEEKVSAAIAKISNPGALALARAPGQPPRPDGRENAAYWRSRRSIRCWPISGPDSDLWGLTGDFFIKTLKIPPSNLPQESVETIRRLSNRKTNRPNKIHDEVLVVFRDVATRDMVMSYASNLAAYKNLDFPPGVRIDYPDHLRGVFSTLESYGHMLRRKLGPKLKRSIKYDDVNMSMCIDVCFPDETRWNKISLRIAEEEVEKEKEKETAIVRQRLDSLSDVADWEGGGTRDRPAPPSLTDLDPDLDRRALYRDPPLHTAYQLHLHYSGSPTTTRPKGGAQPHSVGIRTFHLTKVLRTILTKKEIQMMKILV